MSEFLLSGWWLLAADQALLKARALCWALSCFAGWCPDPAPLLPQGRCQTSPEQHGCGSLPLDLLTAPGQGHTPTKVGIHPQGPRPVLRAGAGASGCILLWPQAELEKAQRR